MPEFKVPLGLLEFLLPVICTGTLLSGVILFAYLYLRSRTTLYLAMTFLGFFALVFVGSEMMILAFGSWLHNAPAGMQFHRSEQLAGAFFIFGLPFLLVYLLDLNPLWRKINRVIAFAALAGCAAITIIAYAYPDSFISQTIHNKNWLLTESNYGRGQEGFLYEIRDTVLGICIIYSLACMGIDLFWHRKFQYLLPPITGILFAIGGAVVDMLFVYTGKNYDLLPDTLFSRFSLGVTLFIVFCMAGLIRRFIDLSKDVELAKERAQREEQRSRRQTDFIKNVLKTSSSSIYSSTENMSSAMEIFSANSQNQAASTEEVTAAIEEISAGADNVERSAGEQHRRLGALTATMAELTGIIANMENTVNEMLNVTADVSGKARSGETSIKVMSESMGKIGASSKEMTGILQIINDISDRINLLSLNAAIEAARAGDAGRGFAVVADEISKLADGTASSIKEIDRLIRANEQEIAGGTANVSAAVTTIASIISNIEKIAVGISTVSGHMTSQLSANESMNSGASEVRVRSEEIMNAMKEQKTGIDEIARTVSGINDLTQSNSAKITEMSMFSRQLVEMVQRLNLEIEEYRD